MHRWVNECKLWFRKADTLKSTSRKRIHSGHERQTLGRMMVRWIRNQVREERWWRKKQVDREHYFKHKFEQKNDQIFAEKKSEKSSRKQGENSCLLSLHSSILMKRTWWAVPSKQRWEADNWLQYVTTLITVYLQHSDTLRGIEVEERRRNG